MTVETISKLCGKPEGDIDPDHTLAELGIDSLDFTLLSMELEDKYGIAELPDTVVTVADVCRHVRLTRTKPLTPSESA